MLIVNSFFVIQYKLKLFSTGGLGSNQAISIFRYGEIAQISHIFTSRANIYDIQVSQKSGIFVS